MLSFAASSPGVLRTRVIDHRRAGMDRARARVTQTPPSGREMDSSREAQRHREMNLSSPSVSRNKTLNGAPRAKARPRWVLCCGASQARRDRSADYEERRRQELLEALGEGYNGELDFAESETASELAPTPGRESYSGEDTPSRSPSRLENDVAG
jgi:hypothetical protein